MISSSFFSALLYPDDQNVIEISAADLGADSFTFRMPATDPVLPEHPIRVVCFHHGLRTDCSSAFTGLSLTVLESDRYSVLYRLISDDPGMIPFMRSVMSDLATYTGLKNNGSDTDLSAFYTAYPAGGEQAFPSDFVSWRKVLFSSVLPDPGWRELSRALPKTVPVLSFPEARRRFLSEPFRDLTRQLISASGLSSHPVSALTPGGVCFGSAGCPDLFPDLAELQLLVRRCTEQDLAFSLLFPPVPENRFDDLIHLLEWLVLPGHPEPERIIVNDWGTVRLIAGRFPGVFRIFAGPLLARRGKDPRNRFRSLPEDTPVLSSANSRSFRVLLKEYGISGILAETCGDPGLILPGDLLTFPFYQLATATRCTLRSACRYGSRGLQPEGDTCARECEKACFGYGQALTVTGRGNSLFSADLRFLSDSAYAAKCLSSGPEALLLDLLE